MSCEQDFVIIDDDDISNLICRKMIRCIVPGCAVQTFNDPQQGLNYLVAGYATEADKQWVILVDGFTLSKNGWEVLDEICLYPDSIIDQLHIYMLLSPIDVLEKKKADQYPFIAGYINKPISVSTLQQLLH